MGDNDETTTMMTTMMTIETIGSTATGERARAER